MPSLDVFRTDAFSMMSLTAAINKLPYKPGLLGRLGIFESNPQRTTKVWVEEQRGKLALLPIAARGTMNAVRSRNERVATPFVVPHVPYHQTIMAEDIQNLRAFGSETELEAIASYVNDQLAAMKQDHEVTWEYHRIGALTGNILDADGTTSIYNLFTEFGLTQISEDFNWDNSSFKTVCTNIIRHIADELGGTPFGQIYAICGNDYFDGVVSHQEVRIANVMYNQSELLRTSQLNPEWYSMAANGLMYSNIHFINYRGDIGDIHFIAPTEAYFFASNVPGLFQEIIAPAPFMETVNTRGLPLYAKQEMLRFDLGVELYTNSNILMMCTRPTSVIKSTICNFSGTGTGCDRQ
jgi:hypothetical protein